MARKAAQSLTPAEHRIIRVLWTRGPSTAAQVAEAIDSPPLAKNTVLTMLGILERKGQIAHDVAGRTFVYRALADETAARRSVLDDVVGRFFGGSRRALLLHVLEEEPIAEDEARRIRRALEAAKDEGG